jgi:hypothetical protein
LQRALEGPVKRILGKPQNEPIPIAGFQQESDSPNTQKTNNEGAQSDPTKHKKGFPHHT